MEYYFGFLLWICCVLRGGSSAVDSKSLLWPMPSSVTSLGSDVRALDSEKFYFQTALNSALLNQAFQRYKGVIFQAPVPFYPDGAEENVKTAMPMLSVKVTSGDEALKPDVDESYQLNTQTGMLTAQTVYGALRGLETFSQLVYHNNFGQFLINSVEVKDSPRFTFRATMIDTSRHFLPVQTILDHLDAMAYNKFNVLHWHIVDDQSFPYTSNKFPNLTIAGAYDKYHVYSQDDITKVITFANNRGIRVIAEFDTPGHTQSWGLGQRDLLTECYDTKTNTSTGSYGPINPILDSTWTFLKDLYTEIFQVFKDEYIHLGGDEVSFKCWQSNPKIQAWMQAHNFTDYSKLEQYYETKLLNMVAGMGKQYVVWQEIFDNKLQVLPDTVINVWKGGNWAQEMNNVTKANLKVILSACWYLNYISYAEDWKKYYQCDPQEFNGTDAQNTLVVGGEACMWGEYVDATNYLSRFWPRGSTVAERLWSAKSMTDTDAAYPRLNNMRCRLLSRQIPAEPLRPGYCAFEWPGA